MIKSNVNGPQTYVTSLFGGVQYVLTIWVAWRVSYKRYNMLTLCELLGSPPIFGEVHVAHLFSLACVLFCLSSSCVLCAQCCHCFWIVHSWLPCFGPLVQCSQRLLNYCLPNLLEIISEKHLAHLDIYVFLLIWNKKLWITGNSVKVIRCCGR